MDRSDGSLLMLASLLIASSWFSLYGMKHQYEIHTAYAGGVITAAKIVNIKEHKQGRSLKRNIDVSYTDQDNRQQQARLEGNGNFRLRVGNAVEISYLPGTYNTARWPDGRVSESEYNRWLKRLKAILFAGILCVLAVPAKRLFRRNDDSDSSILDTKSRFVLKLSFGRMLLNLVVFTGFFSLLYVCVYLYLFQLAGLALITSQILMAAASGLFLLAIWNAVRPAIGHHPLVLTRRGFSIYNHGEVRWREVSEIMIFRGYRNSHMLRFYLNDGSDAEPRQRAFGKEFSPARVVLSLECINWDDYELREELIRFALTGRDDDAAVAFRRSTLNAEQESSGPISWPENMRDKNPGAPKPKRSKSNYMSGGFHLNNH